MCVSEQCDNIRVNGLHMISMSVSNVSLLVCVRNRSVCSVCVCGVCVVWRENGRKMKDAEIGNGDDCNNEI